MHHQAEILKTKRRLHKIDICIYLIVRLEISRRPRELLQSKSLSSFALLNRIKCIAVMSEKTEKSLVFWMSRMVLVTFHIVINALDGAQVSLHVTLELEIGQVSRGLECKRFSGLFASELHR